MYPNLCKNYADVVTVETCPYGSDCRDLIWLRSLIREDLKMLAIILSDNTI